MDALREWLDVLRKHGLERGHTLGLLHIIIGRRVKNADGKVVLSGLTWRQAAALLKKARWPKDAVEELGLDPAKLPPRDRQQYWYSAISSTGVDSAAARAAGDKLAAILKPLGYEVS